MPHDCATKLKIGLCPHCDTLKHVWGAEMWDITKAKSLKSLWVWSDLTYCNQTRHRWHLRTAVNHQRGAMLSWVSSIACFKPHFTCLCLLCHRPSVSGWEVIKKTSRSCRECDLCLFLGLLVCPNCTNLNCTKHSVYILQLSQSVFRHTRQYVIQDKTTQDD